MLNDAADIPAPAASYLTSHGVDRHWYLWDGGCLAVGRREEVIPTHAHHAFQMVVSVDAPFKISINDEAPQEFSAAIILPDVRHSGDVSGTSFALLLVDPDSFEGRLLWRSYRTPIAQLIGAHVPEAQRAVSDFLNSARTADGASALVRTLIEHFCLGLLPPRHLDNRIAKGIEIIKQLGPRSASPRSVAQALHLSPSRFAHLFKTNVGLSFGQYLLWRRVSRAMLLASRGATLSKAAHAAGFADAPHFTRSFTRVFGLTPSVFLGCAELNEIDSPLREAPPTEMTAA